MDAPTAGAAATPLNSEEAKDWTQVQRTLEGFALALQEGAPEAVIDATLTDLRALPFDHTRVLNALHLPDNAGASAPGLEKIMRRIPDGWGRWVSTGPGWYPLLVALDETLACIDPNYEVQQVKEKYARLCYYYSASPADYLQDRALTAAVAAAERQAAHTCELCGAPGQFMATADGSGGWYQTLCLKCAAASGHNYAPPAPSPRPKNAEDLRHDAFSALPRTIVCRLALTLAQQALPIYEQSYPRSSPPLGDLLALASAYDLASIGLPSDAVLQAAHLANTLSWSVARDPSAWHSHSLARDASACVAQAIESIAFPLHAWAMAQAAIDSSRQIALNLAQRNLEEGLSLDKELTATRAARSAFDTRVDALIAALSAVC